MDSLLSTTVSYLGMQTDTLRMAKNGHRGPEPTDKSEEIVAALRSGRPFMGTGELADALGYESNPGVVKHLNRAEESGKIEKVEISGYNVWCLPEVLDHPPETNTGPAPGEAIDSRNDRGSVAYNSWAIGGMDITQFGTVLFGLAFPLMLYIWALFTPYSFSTYYYISSVGFGAVLWLVGVVLASGLIAAYQRVRGE